MVVTKTINMVTVCLHCLHPIELVCIGFTYSPELPRPECENFIQKVILTEVILAVRVNFATIIVQCRIVGY